mmetsp:Transcript_26089/g.46388  ORF Transcript_26089/g.46388 Transcript_26089/m.46388 type:complete len:92 (+) Transcript_26089:340-615(+)
MSDAHCPLERADSNSSTGSPAKLQGGRDKGARQGWLLRLRRTVWDAVCWLLDEFEPWVKWLVYDALLTLLTAALARRWKQLNPLFEALGWL